MKGTPRPDTNRAEVYTYCLSGVNSVSDVTLAKSKLWKCEVNGEESNKVARRATRTGVEKVSDCCYIQFSFTLIIAFPTFMKFNKVTPQVTLTYLKINPKTNQDFENYSPAKWPPPPPPPSPPPIFLHR